MAGFPPKGQGAETGRGTSAAQAFPRRARLTRPTEFKRVFARPVVSTDRYFRVLARRSDGDGPRLGMAVSRRVDRKATERNRIKRIVRESFRRHFAADRSDASGQVESRPAVDIVVLPTSGCATISNAQLFRSLETHWARVVAQCGSKPRRP